MNPRRRRFVQEYLKDLNGTEAAVRAGYSRASAHVTASRLLKNHKLADAVDAAIAQRAVRVEAKADDVLRELLRLATVDVGMAFDSKGRLLPLASMSEDVRRSIASIEVEEIIGAEGVVLGHLKKVKLWDKGAALERLGKHLRLFDGKAPNPNDALQTSARWEPTEGKRLLAELRQLRAGRDTDPDTEH